MKWSERLKKICSRSDCRSNKNVEKGHSQSERQAAKKRVAIQWLLVAILLVMPSVAHIFTAPFFLFGPANTVIISVMTNISDVEFNSSEVFNNCTAVQSPNGFTMDNTLLNDMHFLSDSILGLQGKLINDANGTTWNIRACKPINSGIGITKYLLFAGLFLGSLLVGPFAAYFGRKLSFKILARVLILSTFLLSMCRSVFTLSTFWLLVGSSLMAMYCIIFVELLEKFDSIIENEPQAEIESTNRSAKFAKFKLRMTVGIGFTFTWILARLLVVLIAWFTRDWTLICMWLGIVFSIIYFCLGDFFTKNFVEDIKSGGPEEEDSENLFKALVQNKIFLLNLFILSVNWFICCNNLYGLVIGWVNLSINRNMFDNTAISSSFVFICIPLALAVCLASKRKVLPYGLLQLFTGVSILLMIAFPSDRPNTKNSPWGTGSIVIAHVANVLVSSSLCILWVISIETFPKKYRIHCLGLCSVSARFGTMVGVALNEHQHFTATLGPAFAGGLSIVAAVLSRLLPDLTVVKMLDSQNEIEREQFPSLGQPNVPAVVEMKLKSTLNSVEAQKEIEDPDIEAESRKV